MVNTPFEFDVVICGGGPGGSACAMGFIGTQIQVAVIEKSTYPREKVCGDGMGPYISKALYRMSPRFEEAFCHFDERRTIDQIRVVSFNGNASTMALPESWFVSKRYHFDNFMYRQAAALPNVHFFTDEQVTKVATADNNVTIETNRKRVFKAKLLIGCDGASSLVRRQLTGYHPPASERCVAVRAYYAGVTEVKPGTFEFYFTPKHPGGYFWIFPSGQGLTNVGFGIFSEDLVKKEMNLRELFQQIMNETPALKNRFAHATRQGDLKGWSIPLGFSRHAISGSRFMLVGDAASVADPLSGEGIGQAIVTGRLAASHAKRCIEEDNFSAEFMKGFDHEVQQKWGGQNRKRRRLGNAISKWPWILDFMILLLNGHGLLRNFARKLIYRITC